MTYQPVIPMGGLGGWAFLSRTRESQEAAFQSSAVIRRDTDYFLDKIGEVRTAEDLVADRRLLRVALGAFGLEADIDSKFFIRKVLEGGTLSGKGLANRLSDTRYFRMAESFAFDLKPPNTVISTFGPEIVAMYRERQFEAAVGNASPDMRLALSLEREIGAILERDMSDAASWYTVMATPPLRAVFERALGIPEVVGALDVDRQLEIFREKARAVFGSDSFRQFGDPDSVDRVRTAFLSRSELAVAPPLAGRGAAALAILQSAAPPSF